MKTVISSLLMVGVLFWAGASFACSSCGCQLAKSDSVQGHLDEAAAAAAGSTEAKTAPEEEASTEAVAAAADAGNKICPVMGGAVSEGVTYEYQGKIYHFCCPACIAEFQKDPEKYIKIVEEELKGN